MKTLSIALGLTICAGLQAATVSTNLSVQATGSIGGTSITATGTATLTNIGNGTFSATVSLTPDSSGNFNAPFTITLTTGDRITGTIKIPASILSGSGTGSATVTGGTGTYAGATGSFPSLAGTGSLGASGISFTFSGAGTITTGGGGGGGGGNAPTITDVLDAASYTKNVAQGSIFVVKGSGLSASGLTSMTFPLPTTSGNVKITFTPATGGAGTDAFLVYLYNQGGVNQLAAILPSTVAPGLYNVTVTYNGSASAGFTTQVVQRKPGLITADSSGTGLGVVQNFISQSQLDIDRSTTFSSSGFTFSPSRPGQVLIAWGVGLGAVTGGDNVASPGFDFTKNGVNVQVIVGGTTITPLYAGRAPGLAGADQINFQLPTNIQTGCTVPFQVSVNGQLSNPSYIAIAPDASSSACVLPGFTTAQLQRFDQGGSYTIGGFSLSSVSASVPGVGSIKLETAGGSFTKFTGLQLAGIGQFTTQVNTTGSCTVIHTTSSGGQVTGGGGILLDAGSITLTGPAASNLNNTALRQDASNAYSLTIGGFGTTSGQSIVAGSYTLRGAGGKDVGSFSTSITIGSPLTLSAPLPTTIVRAAGLPLAWTGGNSSDLVQIVGSSSTSTGSGANLVTDTWTFICTTTAGQGSFTVPASVLTQLPAVSASSTSGGGFLSVASSVPPSTFTASLTAGGSIDAGAFLSFVGTGGQVAYQ